MAVKAPNDSSQQPGRGPGSTTPMGSAFERAGIATGATAGPAAPAPGHPSLNVGSGRNPDPMSVNTNSQPSGPGAAGPGAGFSFRNLGTGMRSMMTRSPASEVLNKLAKAMGDLYEEAAAKDFTYTLIPVDMNNTSSLSVSVLVLAVQDTEKLNLGVAYHTLIVEASAEAPAPRYVPINGVNVEVVRTLAEAFDATMIREVQERVARAFPRETNLFNTEATLVPRDFKIEDKERLYRLAANTAYACSQELQVRDSNFIDLNLARAEHDSNLQVRTLFNQPQQEDAVGSPQRADVVIDFSAAPLNQNQNQQNLERTQSVSRLTGFIDMVWDPLVQQQGQFGMPQPAAWGAPQMSTVCYAARLVITQLESTQALTIGSQLLALVPAVALSENNAWTQNYKSAGFSAGKDIRDIGAIGYEVKLSNDPNVGYDRVDTKSDSFKPEHLHQLLSMTFRPGLIISLDVPECGPQTWYNSVFGATAEGDPRAIEAVLRAANMLTNGNFQNFFDPSKSRIAMDENNRIQLGYYTNPVDGQRHDLREIDYLAILNLVGDKDLSVVKKWSNTFLASTPIEQRLAERKQIITGVAPDAVITGYARRVTFSQDFITALVGASKAAGLTMRASTNYQDLSTFERATGQHLGSAMMSSDVTGMFNRGSFGQAVSGAGMGSAFTRRW